MTTDANFDQAIPFLDLVAQHRPLTEEILAAWRDILETTQFIGGRAVSDFERDFAQTCGAGHCVGVNSGTDALRFIFIALGLKAGDEVITVPNTFIATTEAISQAGGVPVFVDIDPETYTLDPARIAAAITPRTRGIVPVHLYGQCADMDPILSLAREKGLWVAEDACQAHLAEYKGRRAGSMGAAAAFSFYPGKNLGACGEAGAVVTSDRELALKVAQLRDHGQSKKYFHDVEGYNGRLDALQAAALSIKLRHLPAWTAQRRDAARRYSDLLKDVLTIKLPSMPAWSNSAWHLYVLLVENRDAVAAALRDAGVAAGLHYPLPLHLQGAYKHRKLGPGSFPVAERCAKKLLSLPLYAEITPAQQDRVARSLRNSISL